MSTIKGIIFDYGGTIDTNGVHWGEFIYAQYIQAGMNIERTLYREAYVYGERALAKAPIIEATDTFHTLLRKKLALHFSYLRQHSSSPLLTTTKANEIADGCYTKVKETLATSRAVVEKLSTQYPMVLVTNFYGNMPIVLKEFNLSDNFGSIVESSVVGLRKPDPALFALGIKALKLEPNEIVVIGDSYRKDIYPASTLGCRTVWLKNICWAEEEVQPGHEATAIIESIENLPAIIESLQ